VKAEDSSSSLLDDDVRVLLSSARVDAAAERVLRALGPELYGYLLAIHHDDEATASDVFSDVSQRIWRGLPAFSFRCSVRGWAYVVARNAARNHLEREGRRRKKLVPLSDSLASILQVVRTQTRTLEKTATRDGITRLRDALPEHDRSLLILRVDRGLSWDDLARTFLGEEEASDDDVRRESARLRKRFQLVKERLAKAARDAGLIQ
jgi:RNA polymerase sigma-70 factor, ECF subfamily